WTVRQALSIGSLDGPEAEQFGQIVGVDVDGEGRIYALDNQSSEVRVFDADGRHLRTFGEPGQGPGQLGRALGGVFLVGDRVLVPDLQNQRVSAFSTDGEPLASFRLDFSAGVPIRWDGPVAGQVVAQRRVLQIGDSAAAPAGDPIVALDSEGAVADTLLVLPPGESLDLSGGGPSFRFFAPEPIWDAGPDGRIASGMNAEFRIEMHAPGGMLERVVVLPREARSVTERDQQVLLDAVREAAMDQGAPPQAVEMMLSGATFADSYPFFASLLVGPEGTLWAQRVRTGDELTGGAEEATFDPQDLGSTVWDVFDAEGRYLGEVEFPGRFQPLRVHGDRIYGVGRDAMDLQSLVAFDVVRPAG
ncbi:MAG: hypothetical protein PVI57_23670, partial [Gemmatimonadota bacterium]